MEKEIAKLYDDVKASVLPQLQEDLEMFLRENKPEVSHCALSIIDQLNKNGGLRNVNLGGYSCFDDAEQNSICDAVINFAQTGGDQFVRFYHPLYMQFYQQASQNFQLMQEISQLTIKIEAAKKRNQSLKEENDEMGKGE